MPENNSNNQGQSSPKASASSGNAPRKPPETPKPKTVSKLCRDSQDCVD